MNNLYNLYNKSTSANILTILLGSMLIFVFGTIVLKLAVYVVPLAAVAYAIYWTSKRIRRYFTNKKTTSKYYPENITSMDSEERIKNAIENNEFIEVEYENV